MSESADAVLELQAAADALGVHYQTAYRWVRSGRLRADLIGGKYVVPVHEVERVIESRSRPMQRSTPGPARLDRQAEKMTEILMDGDEFEARRIARRLVDEGTTLVELIEAVFVPPLRAIGQAWHDGELTIWVEHRASAIVERTLGDLLPNPRGRRRGTAMVAALAGDSHSLPTTMATVALREHNWHVHHLGANMPADEIVAFCSSHDVDIAVISVTNPDVAEQAERVGERLRKAGIPAIVGGGGRTLSDLVADVQSAVNATSA